MAYTTTVRATSQVAPRSVRNQWTTSEATQVTVLSMYPRAPTHTDVTTVGAITNVEPTNP